MISSAADVVVSVFATDLDGDGDTDVLSASLFDDDITWYENLSPCGFDSDCDGGFAQMLDNQLTILTDRADPAGDIDQAGADAELTEAIATQAPDQASREAKDRALARARARRRLAAKR